MIANKFLVDYTQRFKSAYNTIKMIPKLRFSKVISDIDNIELTKLPNLEEVNDALFSIDSNKTPRLDGFGACFSKNY